MNNINNKINNKMNLDKMLDILKAKCSDYERTNAEIIKTLNLPTSRLLKDYMEQIKHDPLLWFKSFPMDYTSIEALAKPKSGVIHVLEKNDEVRTDLGKEFCDDLVRRLHATWKANKAELLQLRVTLKDSSSDKNVFVPKSSGPSNKISNDKIEELEKENKELRAYLDEADEKIHALDTKCTRLQADTDSMKHEEIMLSKAKDQLAAERNASVARIEQLKSIFIDCMKEKGATEAEISIYNKLLSVW